MDCAMCGSKGLFQVEDLPVGPRWFCTEKHYAEYVGLPVREFGYYGFEAEESKKLVQCKGDEHTQDKWTKQVFILVDADGKFIPCKNMIDPNRIWIDKDGKEWGPPHLDEHGEEGYCDDCITYSVAAHTWALGQGHDAEGESKKLPPVEKAIDTGIASGATMEGLETLLAAEWADEHPCEHCGSTDIDYGNNWKCHDCGRYAAEEYEVADEDWKGMKLDMVQDYDDAEGESWKMWTYKDGDIYVQIDGSNGHISTYGKRELTMKEAKTFLKSKGIPFDSSTDCKDGSCIHHGEWDLVYFNYPNHERCYKHDWGTPITIKGEGNRCGDVIQKCNFPSCEETKFLESKIHEWGDFYIKDYDYGDGEFYSTQMSQECEHCGKERRGHGGGKVEWDFEAESFAAEEYEVANEENEYAGMSCEDCYEEIKLGDSVHDDGYVLICKKCYSNYKIPCSIEACDERFKNDEWEEEHRQESCNECEGHGWIMTSYTPATYHDPADADGHDCEACDGEGLVCFNAESFSADEQKACHRCGKTEKDGKLWWVGSRKGFVCGDCSNGGKKYRAESNTFLEDATIVGTFEVTDGEIPMYAQSMSFVWEDLQMRKAVNGKWTLYAVSAETTDDKVLIYYAFHDDYKSMQIADGTEYGYVEQPMRRWHDYGQLGTDIAKISIGGIDIYTRADGGFQVEQSNSAYMDGDITAIRCVIKPPINFNPNFDAKYDMDSFIYRLQWGLSEDLEIRKNIHEIGYVPNYAFGKELLAQFEKKIEHSGGKTELKEYSKAWKGWDSNQPSVITSLIVNYPYFPSYRIDIVRFPILEGIEKWGNLFHNQSAESFATDTVTVNCHKCDAPMEVEAWKHNKKNPITGQRLNIRHLCAKCSPQPQGLITYGAESKKSIHQQAIDTIEARVADYSTHEDVNPYWGGGMVNPNKYLYFKLRYAWDKHPEDREEIIQQYIRGIKDGSIDPSNPLPHGAPNQNLPSKWGAESDELDESKKRTKMSMIRTGLAITTFGIVMWNLWTNKKQEKDISDIMDLV